MGFDGYLTMEIGFDKKAVEPDKIARDADTYVKELVKREGVYTPARAPELASTR